MTWDERDQALSAMLEQLKSLGYRFVPPTPATHRRVTERAEIARARDLRDIFGWSRPFARDTLPSELFALLDRAEMIERSDGEYRSAVRVASMGEHLFLHSAYPTDRLDSVFLGPDSYRFVRFLNSELANVPPVSQLVDVGAGSGVGAIMAAKHLPGARLVLTDINPLALRLSRINARQNGVVVETLTGSGIEPVVGQVELVITNPPFIFDQSGPLYRQGGEMHGAALSLEWSLSAAERLAPGGRALIYTGSAIIAGHDRLEAALREQLLSRGCTLSYHEIDPDIFGEQLEEPGYEDVERIAAVAAVITRSGAFGRG